MNMSILMWEKPKKAMSTEEWANSGGFDGGPPGGYIPNMSKADRLRWKAKYIGGKYPRVEIRKTTTNGSQLLVIVTKGGFPPKGGRETIEYNSDGKHVRFSLNGPAFFSVDEFFELENAVKEAYSELEKKGN